MEISSGLFAAFGTIIGAGITYFSNRHEKDWKKIKDHISILTEQLLAYNKLEELYAEKISTMNPNEGATITVKIKMRDIVAAMNTYSRPEITPTRIKSIRSRWK